jgi:hypothetical protein
VFQWARTIGRRSSSRFMVIWRSVLSWMHWYLTPRKRARHLEKLLSDQHRLMEQHQAQLLLLEEILIHQLTKQDLLEALRPAAAALLRQDSLASQRQEETKELLLEVLNSLQPEVEDQIFQRIGPPPPTSSFPASVS